MIRQQAQRQWQALARHFLPLSTATRTPLSTASATTSTAPTEVCKSVLPSQQIGKGDRVVVLGSGWAGFQLVRAIVVCSREDDMLASGRWSCSKINDTFLSLGPFLPLIASLPRNISTGPGCQQEHAIDGNLTSESLCLYTALAVVGGWNVGMSVGSAQDEMRKIRPFSLMLPFSRSCLPNLSRRRCIQEPVRSHLGPHGSYVQAKARTLDPVSKTITCEAVDNEIFTLEYDKLVIAVGVKTNTFGIESISEREQSGDGIFFLKQLWHARAIRSNIIDSFEKASLPHMTDDERKSLLSFLVVGGGPTS